MKYHNITKDDMLNGVGLRVVLWVAGCSHCCKECQNPITWDPNGGLEFDEAAKQEIIRRYYTALNKMALGAMNETEVNKIRLLMQKANISTDDRVTTVAAKKRAMETQEECSAIELSDGTMITAGSSVLLGTCASLLLNAIKHLAGIDHEVKLISQDFIEPIQKTKVDYLGGKNPRLHMDEVLVALSVLSLNDDNCRRALDMLPKLNGLQAHATVMLSQVDQKILKKLGISLTCDPVTKK